MSINRVRLIEELAANAWRPEIEQHLGGWRLRFTGGNSRRVNSVWPNAAPNGESLEVCLDIVEDFYRRREMLPRFQICPAALPIELPQILADSGYVFTAHTEVQVQSIEGLLAVTSPPAELVIASAVLTEDWFQTYTSVSGYHRESLPIRRGILSRIGPPAHFILLVREGKPIAAGLGVAERGWLGVFCVVTAEQVRRMGYASGVMHILGQWGKAHGAENLYLQVMENNPPALNLYRKLGFTKLYRYYYAEKVGTGELGDVL